MERDLLALEWDRRQGLPRLLAGCFDKQHAFINDPSRRKAAFVARRSGKTWAIAVYLIKTALEAPATKCLYYGFTRESAWNTIYQHMLEPICEQFGIKYKENLTLQTLTFANGSRIKITGDDASDRQIDKALGAKYKLVVFDECQDIAHDLRKWVNNKLAPAMVDLDGTIVLAGTAGEHMGERYWYQVTKTEGIREPGWSVHSWTPFDNPFMAEKVAAYFERKRAEDAGYDSTPEYQREWLCRWVVETENRIYRYDPAKNGMQAYDYSSKLWRYVIGLDFGYEDDTALVVGAYHPHEDFCLIVDSFKRKKMLLDEVADLIAQWRDTYRPILIVGDAQNKTLVETLRARNRISIQPAQKLGKVEHIAAMNSDFRRGKIRVIEPKNRPLIKEWDELTWDERKRQLGTFQENPSKDNHLADAALYMHHATKHFRATPEPVPDAHESPMRKQAEHELRTQLAQKQDGMGLYDEIERVA